MRKLILITTCVALFAVTSYAQQDTTKTRTKQSSDQLRDRPASENMKGWNRVNSSDVPASLRQTLSGPTYTGWESGTIYMNEAGDTYSLRTSDKNNPKTYYFDKNGKVTKKPNGN